MAHLLLTNQRQHHFVSRGIRKRTAVKTFRIGNFSLMMIMVFFIGAITLLYLFHFNKVSTKGYYVNMLEGQRQQLVMENELHLMKLAEISSLDYIRSNEHVAGMVRAKNPIYLHGTTAVAKR